MGDYSNMTAPQKAECIALAAAMERVKAIPGGSGFIADLFLEIAQTAGLKLVKSGEGRAACIHGLRACAIAEPNEASPQ